jgi:Outer membrane protein
MRFFALSIFALCLNVVPVQGQEAFKPTVMAVVDVGYILREASAAKSALEEVNASITKLEAEAEQAELLLRDKRNRLTDSDLDRESEQFKINLREFEAEASKLQLDFRQRRQELQAGLERARRMLSDGLKPILQKMVEERSIDLLIDRSRVIYANDNMDITLDALARINQEIPSIPSGAANQEGQGS